MELGFAMWMLMLSHDEIEKLAETNYGGRLNFWEATRK